MLRKLRALFKLFRHGQEVANKSAWKVGGNAAMALAALFMSAVELSRMFGYDVQLTTEQAGSISGGVVTIVLFVVHNITSKHAGVLPAEPTSNVVSEDQSTESKPVSNDNEAVVKKAQEYIDKHNEDLYKY